MRSFAIDEPGSSVRALYATLTDTERIMILQNLPYTVGSPKKIFAIAISFS